MRDHQQGHVDDRIRVGGAQLSRSRRNAGLDGVGVVHEEVDDPHDVECSDEQPEQQAFAARATVMQQKTQRPVQFEITGPTRDAVTAWIGEAGLLPDDCLFPVVCVREVTSALASTPGLLTAG